MGADPLPRRGQDGWAKGRAGLDPVVPVGAFGIRTHHKSDCVGPRFAFLVSVIREMTGWGEGGFVEQQGSFVMRSIYVGQVLVSGEFRCLGLVGRGQSAPWRCP